MGRGVVFVFAFLCLSSAFADVGTAQAVSNALAEAEQAPEVALTKVADPPQASTQAALEPKKQPTKPLAMFKNFDEAIKDKNFLANLVLVGAAVVQLVGFIMASFTSLSMLTSVIMLIAAVGWTVGFIRTLDVQYDLVKGSDLQPMLGVVLPTYLRLIASFFFIIQPLTAILSGDGIGLGFTNLVGIMFFTFANAVSNLVLFETFGIADKKTIAMMVLHVGTWFLLVANYTIFWKPIFPHLYSAEHTKDDAEDKATHDGGEADLDEGDAPKPEDKDAPEEVWPDKAEETEGAHKKKHSKKGGMEWDLEKAGKGGKVKGVRKAIGGVKAFFSSPKFQSILGGACLLAGSGLFLFDAYQVVEEKIAATEGEAAGDAGAEATTGGAAAAGEGQGKK